jgi:hypothetical protein
VIGFRVDPPALGGWAVSCAGSVPHRSRGLQDDSGVGSLMSRKWCGELVAGMGGPGARGRGCP